MYTCIEDQGQSQQIQDSPEDSGTVGAYIVEYIIHCIASSV